MNARLTNLQVTVESTAVAPRPYDSDDGTGGGPGPGRWKLALESRWQRKIDEVVILSQARSGISGEPGETVAVPGVRRSRRLGSRIDAALGEVAAIEEAMARLDAGSYGICGGCDQPMAAEWLADTPETRYCPECSLRLVSWQTSSPPAAEGVRVGDTRGAAAEAQPPRPKAAAHQKRRQGSAAGSGTRTLRAVARNSGF